MKTSALVLGKVPLAAVGTLFSLLVAAPASAQPSPSETPEAVSDLMQAPLARAPDDVERPAGSLLNPYSRSETHILPGWQFGFVGSYSATFVDEEDTDHEGGVGVMLDHFLIDNVLEIGGGVRLLRGRHTSVAFEALVDVPYHITPHFEIYGGLGGVSVVAIDAENRFGGTAVLGVHVWFDERYGFLVEAGYALLSGEEIGHEVGISIGPIIEL